MYVKTAILIILASPAFAEAPFAGLEARLKNSLVSESCDPTLGCSAIEVDITSDPCTIIVSVTEFKGSEIARTMKNEIPIDNLAVDRLSDAPGDIDAPHILWLYGVQSEEWVTYPASEYFVSNGKEAHLGICDRETCIRKSTVYMGTAVLSEPYEESLLQATSTFSDLATACLK